MKNKINILEPEMQLQKKESINDSILNPESIEKYCQTSKYDSELTKSLKRKLIDLTSAKEAVVNINNQISDGFQELKSILESRYELSKALKDFNDSTKNIISQKEK